MTLISPHLQTEFSFCAAANAHNNGGVLATQEPFGRYMLNQAAVLLALSVRGSICADDVPSEKTTGMEMSM